MDSDLSIGASSELVGTEDKVEGSVEDVGLPSDGGELR